MRKTVLTFALAGCLFLLIVGAKWATFGRYGSPMPDWDQWDAEAVELFIPWFENDEFLKHLFHPHNEHRIILTKLQNLGLVLLNGQWDSRLEAVTNAMLHAALAVAFWMFGRRWLAPHWHALLFVLIAALFALPLAWQNILGGFHSQQYWLLGLSFAAIVTLPFARSWSASWWIGVVSAVLAVGSMGSGFLAAAVVIVVVGWRLLRRQATFRAAWPALVFMAAIVVGGLLTRVEVDWHQNLKAKTIHDFFFSIVHSLQWPLRDADWAAAVLWLPWLLVLWRVVKHPDAAHSSPQIQQVGLHGGSDLAPPFSLRADQSIAALGGWVIIQVVATAYARGAGADYPASRYMDTLAFGATVNAVAMGWWLTIGQRALPRRIVRYALGIAWLVTLGLGLRGISVGNVRYELPNAKKYYIKAEGNMRRYLATNDPRQLAHPDIPFPSADALVERLSHRCIRDLMPVPIRAALPMKPDASAAVSGFQENNAITADWENPPRLGLSPQTAPLDDTPTWGSFAAEPGASEIKTWKSAPLTARLGGWLKIETAGDLRGADGAVRLQLQHPAGAILAEVVPSRAPPGNTWRAAYVRAPRGSFVIVATDTSRREWLAFGPPVEMAALSYWAWQATRHGELVFGFAVAATLVLVAWFVVLSRQERLAERAAGCL